MEIGSRSLMEPTEHVHIQSIISNTFPNVNTMFVNPIIITAAPAKTFLEKACLLHELFFVNTKSQNANHRSRHLYDLERLMDYDFAKNAIKNDELWNSILHHRSLYTSIQGIDYTTDFRKNIILCPPENVITAWAEDYKYMCQTMIYGNKLPFDKLIERIHTLEQRFHNAKL